MTVDSMPKLIVVSIDDMDRVALRKHFNHRHEDNLGYAGMLPHNIFENYDDYVERCYRAFHETLHRLRFDLSHEHEI